MSESKTLVQHALTVLVGQLAVISFGVADTIIVGRYDPLALAALSIGSAIYISVYVALLGVLQAMLPVFAELHGANASHNIGKQFHQGLYLLVALSCLGMVILVSPEFILHWTEVPKELNQGVFDYLFWLAMALPPALFFRMFSTLSQSVGHPKMVSVIQVLALLVKIPLSIFLAFGFDLFPSMGLQGCALATLIVNFAMLLISIWLLKNSSVYVHYGIWRKLHAPHFKDILHLARLGIPNGLSVTVEVTSFTLMALFIAKMGITASASHQIAANLAALLYMLPLSFSIATSARASYWVGANNIPMAKKTIFTGFKILMTISLAICILMWFTKEEIAAIYVKDSTILGITTQLIGLICVYHFFDALQTICFFTLRSLKVVIMPFLIYTLLLWGVGLIGGYTLAYERDFIFFHSPAAFWCSSSLALFLVSMCLVLLIHQELKNLAAKS